MDISSQKRAPIYEALERFRRNRVVPLMYRDTNTEGAIRNWSSCWANNVSVLM